MSRARRSWRFWNNGRKVTPRQNRVFLEPLEPRLLLSAVVAHWIGGSGNWSDPTHWDIGAAPNNGAGNTYTAIIDVAGTPTITVDQNVTINSLTNAESMVVQTGTTTVAQQTTNSGSIQVANAAAQLSLSGTITDTGEIASTVGALSLTNGTLTASGANGHVIASGNTTVSSMNLYAASGGIVSLLGAATYTSGSGGNTVQATGVSSRIDLCI